MKTAVRPLILLLTVLAAACAAPLTKPPEPIPENLTYRIDFLSQLIDTGSLDPRDREIAERIRAFYRQLLNGRQPGDKGYRSDESLPAAIVSLESAYFTAGGRSSSAASDESTFTRFSAERQALLNAYRRGDYPEVTRRCVELRARFGSGALTPEIGLLLALSLAGQGQLDSAQEISGGIARELEGLPDRFELKTRMAEWALGRADLGEADRLQYELKQDLARETLVLDELGRRIALAREESRPVSEMTSGKIPDPLSRPIPENDLVTIKRLADEGRFPQARELLEDRSASARTSAEIEAIEQALRYLESAEEKFLQSRIAGLETKQESLASARKLLEQEKYEQAIAQIDALESEQRTNPESVALRDLAVERLINLERNRAARLFLLARGTQDPARQEAYLRMCLEILAKLDETYPLSSLNEKIKSHIATVREELARIRKE